MLFKEYLECLEDDNLKARHILKGSKVLHQNQTIDIGDKGDFIKFVKAHHGNITLDSISIKLRYLCDLSTRSHAGKFDRIDIELSMMLNSDDEFFEQTRDCHDYLIRCSVSLYIDKNTRNAYVDKKLDVILENEYSILDLITIPDSGDNSDVNTHAQRIMLGSIYKLKEDYNNNNLDFIHTKTIDNYIIVPLFSEKECDNLEFKPNHRTVYFNV